jgi:hypothetical protein
MDMGPAYAKSVRADGHAPRATICYDPFYGDLVVMPRSGSSGLCCIKRTLEKSYCCRSGALFLILDQARPASS